MTTATRDVQELEAEIRRAHEAGDKATLERLQEEYRSGGYPIERVYTGPNAVTIRDEQRSASSTTRPLPTTPTVRGGSGLTTVIAADADEAIRESDVSDGLELAGGLYGRWGDNEIHVERATVFRDTVRTRHRTEIHLRQLQDMDQHFRAAGWRAVGEWHSHVTPGHPASSPDKNGWIAQADARGLSWLGVIVEPRSTWTGTDWDRPTFRAFLARPGESRVAPVPVIVETRSWS